MALQQVNFFKWGFKEYFRGLYFRKIDSSPGALAQLDFKKENYNKIEGRYFRYRCYKNWKSL
jgi:hypothetical protein